MKYKIDIFALIFCVILEKCKIFASELNNEPSTPKEFEKKDPVINLHDIDKNFGNIKQINVTKEAEFLVKENKKNDLNFAKMDGSIAKAIKSPLSEHADSNDIFDLNSNIIAFAQRDIESRRLLNDLVIEISKKKENNLSKGHIIEDVKKFILDLEMEKTDLQKDLEKSLSSCKTFERKLSETKIEINKTEGELQELLKGRNEKLQECQKLEENIKNEKDHLQLRFMVNQIDTLKSKVSILNMRYSIIKKNTLPPFKKRHEYLKNFLRNEQTKIKLIERKIIEYNDLINACKKGSDIYSSDEEKLQNFLVELLIKNIKICFENTFDIKAANINFIYSLTKNILEKQEIFNKIVDLKNNLRESIFHIKNLKIIDEKNTIITISYNCHESNINYIVEMHKIIDELKLLYDEIEFVKKETQILDIIIQKDLFKLRNTELKNFYNRQNQVSLDINKIAKDVILNANFKKDLENQLTFEDKKIINEYSEIKIKDELSFKKFFEIQSNIEKIDYTEPKIKFLYDKLSCVDKEKQNLFYEMCHSELIFYINQVATENKKSGEIHNIDKNSQSKQQEKSETLNSENNGNPINTVQTGGEIDNNNQNGSDKNFGTKNEINDFNPITKNLQDKKNDPFYTKIWFITLIFICVAVIIVISIYYFKKQKSY
ncbi:hypothetical protein GVAV_002176 [Gurleya vavrai]